MAQMRLQKFLSTAGVCSRRKGEEWIAKGDIAVNGQVVTTPGTQVDPDTDTIAVRGRVVRLSEDHVYIALNKPVRYESTCKNDKSRERTVLDLVNVPQRVYPVGRLDKDSQGLILLTNDGRIHHRLSHPSFEHEKEYVVGAKTDLSDDDLAAMARGMHLSEFETQPCRIKRIDPKTFSIILKEGKNRQIRKMVSALNNEVRFLNRIRIAHIRLGALKPGAWRHLTAKELSLLLKSVGIDDNKKEYKPSQHKYEENGLRRPAFKKLVK